LARRSAGGAFLLLAWLQALVPCDPEEFQPTERLANGRVLRENSKIDFEQWDGFAYTSAAHTEVGFNIFLSWKVECLFYWNASGSHTVSLEVVGCRSWELNALR
jgi:hypothetical protein